MKTLTTPLSTAAALASLGLVAPVFSETTKQTIVLTEVDPLVLATGA